MDTNRQNLNNLDEWPYSPKFQQFADFIGLPAAKDSKGVYWRGDRKIADKMEEIYAWGKAKTDSEDIVDVMLAVRALTRDLGVNFKGKTLVDHLWGWIQLDTKNAALNKEMLRNQKEMELYKTPPPPSVEQNTTVEAGENR